MNLNLLNEKFRNCKCKKEHNCPIDHVSIGSGAISKLLKLCENYFNILLVCDSNTYEACGKDVAELLGKKVETLLVLNKNGGLVIPNEEKISETEEKISNKTDFIIGVGSGVINDICKHVSYKHDLFYGIVATAPSMDGYASVGAALILNGMKITLNARPPKIIIGDTSVLKDAPFEMLQAGYGDIIGKYSCLNDWKLSTIINDEYFCEEIYNLTLSQAETVKKFASSITDRNEEAVGALMEALVTVGVAMSYVGNSRPASGSEHHLSHFFEITGILGGKEYYPHGIDVMYSSAVTAKIRENILNATPSEYRFDKNKWEQEIKRIYSSSSEEVILLQEKMGWYEQNEYDRVIGKMSEITAILKEAPSFSESVEMLSEIGLSYDEFEKFYGTEKIKDAVLYAKDLKDRYTVLWLNYKFFSETAK